MRTRIFVALGAALLLAVGAQEAWSRVGGHAGAAASFRLVTVASGLSSPVYATVAPGDKRLFVVEQGGTIRTVSKGKVAARPYADLRRFVKSGGEQGLLSVAFSPKFASNGKLYVYFTNQAGNEVVWELHARKGAASVRPGHRQLLEIPDTESNHNGGQLQFGPDGMLYIGDGDGGGGGDQHGAHGNGQNPGVLLGKLMRIDVNTRTSGLALRHPHGQPVRGPGGLAPRDLGSRPAQPVALLLRPERRSLDGRRRSERVGGGRPRQARARRDQLRLEPLRGPARLCQGHAPGRGKLACPWPSTATRTAEHHRRLRLPRAEDRGLSGRYVYADYCSGKMWTLATSGGAPRDVSSVVSDAGVKSITSFGENGSGMLYVCSGEGTLYRFAAR